MLAHSLQVRLTVPWQDTGPHQTVDSDSGTIMYCTASWPWVTPADALLLTSDSVVAQAVGALGQARLKGDDLRGLDRLELPLSRTTSTSRGSSAS
jgi:hypothetical protein